MGDVIMDGPSMQQFEEALTTMADLTAAMTAATVSSRFEDQILELGRENSVLKAENCSLIMTTTERMSRLEQLQNADDHGAAAASRAPLPTVAETAVSEFDPGVADMIRMFG